MAKSATAEPIIKSDLEVIEEQIAALEARCNRDIKSLGSWTANQSYEFERGPLKDLKELKRKRGVLLRSSKKKTEGA